MAASKKGTYIMNVWHIGYGEHLAGGDNGAWQKGGRNPKAEEIEGRKG